jgi:hypothetical protein
MNTGQILEAFRRFPADERARLVEELMLARVNARGGC